MRIFVPLKQRAVAQLWAGQLLSGVGDEINRVAAVWLAATLWGNEAGYLMAVNAAAALAFSVLGGRWVDRRDPVKTMIAADLVRAAAVAVVPIGAALGVGLGPLLLVSVALCGGMTMFFDPALRGLTPALVPSPELRGATTALIESTSRLARVVGPSLAALCAAFVPMIHFFTVDAVTYVASAWLIAYLLRPGALPNAGSRLSADAAGDVERTWQRVRAQPVLAYGVFTGPVVNAAWTLLMPMGMGLLVHERMPSTPSAFAFVIAAYGCGNLVANVAVGSFAERRPERPLYLGRSTAGLGFLLFAVSDSYVGLLAASALAACGGPVSDIGLLGLLQTRLSPAQMARVYRVYITWTFGAIFALFFVSPRLFDRFGIAPVLFASAAVILGIGATGLFRFFRLAEPEAPARLSDAGLS